MTIGQPIVRLDGATLCSHWVFVYAGETAGIATRKIERFLQHKLLDIRTREDWPHAGAPRPMIEGFIETTSADWGGALRETLALARRFSAQWDMRLHDIDGDMHGHADRHARETHGGAAIDGPACLLSIHWHLRRDQGYARY